MLNCLILIFLLLSKPYMRRLYTVDALTPHNCSGSSHAKKEPLKHQVYWWTLHDLEKLFCILYNISFQIHVSSAFSWNISQQNRREIAYNVVTSSGWSNKVSVNRNVYCVLVSGCFYDSLSTRPSESLLNVISIVSFTLVRYWQVLQNFRWLSVLTVHLGSCWEV